MTRPDDRVGEPEPITAFIERFGLLKEEEGASRTSGRIMALLLTAGGPVSFSDIATKLRVSRGGVSTNLRLLEEMGMVERISLPGDRRDYFQLPDDSWRKASERKIARESKKRQAVMALLASDALLAASARQRLEDIVERLQMVIEQARRDLEGRQSQDF